MHEAGLSNRFCPSVVCRLSVRRRKLKSRHIDPSKWSQTIANSKKNCSMCTWLKSRRSVWLYFGYFLLFITIHNRAPPLRNLRVPSRTGHAVHLETCASRWPLGNSVFSRSMYFTGVVAIVSAVFSSYFLLFVTFCSTSPASQYNMLYIR